MCHTRYGISADRETAPLKLYAIVLSRLTEPKRYRRINNLMSITLTRFISLQQHFVAAYFTISVV